MYFQCFSQKYSQHENLGHMWKHAGSVVLCRYCQTCFPFENVNQANKIELFVFLVRCLVFAII